MITEQIEESELEKDCWYIGRGRNGNIGKWDGEHFLVLAKRGIYTGKTGKDKWCMVDRIKYEPYFHDLPCSDNKIEEIVRWGQCLHFTFLVVSMKCNAR